MSARAVTERSAVLGAIAECDRLGREAFLERYGFAQSSRYALAYEGKHYDPAAIIAVAHREQHGRVLEGAVKGAWAVLEQLGFEIVDLTPPWREDEMVLALHTYMGHRGERLGKTHRAVRELSDTLRRLAAMQGDTRRSAFRNPAGVEQQLGRFLLLDPRSTIAGRGQPSALHREIWAHHSIDPLALQRRATEILNALDGIPRSGAPRIEAPPLEAREPTLATGEGAEVRFAPFLPRRELLPRKQGDAVQIDAKKQDRADAAHEELRVALGQHLARCGFTPCGAPEGLRDLECDLVARGSDMELLIEVKSLPTNAREDERLRLGLGQLLWYRSRWYQHLERSCVAVLCVEHEPPDAEAWRRACDDVAVVLTWPERFTSLVDACRKLAVLKRGHVYR